MKDFKLFATDSYPLHPSGLRSLIDCPWRMVDMFLLAPDQESGPAADTGSAVHAAAHAMHEGKEVAEALAIMHAKLADYPRADLLDASDLFLKYAADVRNREAKIVATETAIRFQIKAAPEDPTGEPVSFIGRLDQVRDTDGRLRVYDLKTSKKDQTTLLHEHTFQMAAYCVGASILFKREVWPGALILVRRYGKSDYSNAPVFWHYSWSFQDCAKILDVVRHRVAEIRRGVVYHNPREEQCCWCHMRTPDLCLPKLQSELKIRETQTLIIESH